ncbi:MAG: hypothetical protein WC516_05715 [Patescibacteria group bacterium]|jgi:peptidoglycan hydrolase CwlO-like protein
MAIQEIKVGQVRRSFYVANNFAEGLTDLVIDVRLPSGDLLDPSPTVVEQGGGTYYIDYTPLTAGIYQEKCSSVINKDYVVRGLKAVLYDLSDVKSAVDGIDTKVDAVQSSVNTMDGKVDAVALDVGSVKTTVEATDGKVDAVATNVSSVKSTVEATDGKVDTINTNVASAKLTIESVDGKIDTQSSKLTTIEGKIDDLDMQVVKGGYFIV